MTDPVVSPERIDTPTAEGLAGLVTMLRDARRHKAAAAALVKEHELAGADLYAAYEAARHVEENLTALVRADALSLYRETGAETPVPGVRIELERAIRYDPKEALAWALKHQMALALDVKQFEKIAVTGVEIPTLVIAREPWPVIAKDLDKALAVADVTAPAPAIEVRVDA